MFVIHKIIITFAALTYQLLWQCMVACLRENIVSLLLFLRCLWAGGGSEYRGEKINFSHRLFLSQLHSVFCSLFAHFNVMQNRQKHQNVPKNVLKMLKTSTAREVYARNVCFPFSMRSARKAHSLSYAGGDHNKKVTCTLSFSHLRMQNTLQTVSKNTRSTAI